MKGINQRRSSQASGNARSAGQPNGAGQAFVTRRKISLECRNRRLYAFGGRPQFLAERRQAIASNVAFDQSAAQALLKLGNATLNGG